MAEVKVNPDFIALVDDEDLKRVSRYRWGISRSGQNVYAVTTVRGRTCSMHRLLLKPPKGLVVDHINRNGLDNRRSNLRIVTQQQNLFNQRKRGVTSRYQGVCRYPSKTNPWQVKITLDGKVKHVGVFTTEEEAAEAYLTAATQREVRSLGGLVT